MGMQRDIDLGGQQLCATSRLSQPSGGEEMFEISGKKASESKMKTRKRHTSGLAKANAYSSGEVKRPKLPRPTGPPPPCPRCDSTSTKFCYYNNYNINQPRFYCKGCQRHWTSGGVLRNVVEGAGRRKSRSTTQQAVRTSSDCSSLVQQMNDMAADEHTTASFLKRHDKLSASQPLPPADHETPFSKNSMTSISTTSDHPHVGLLDMVGFSQDDEDPLAKLMDEVSWNKRTRQGNLPNVHALHLPGMADSRDAPVADEVMEILNGTGNFGDFEAAALPGTQRLDLSMPLDVPMCCDLPSTPRAQHPTIVPTSSPFEMSVIDQLARIRSHSRSIMPSNKERQLAFDGGAFGSDLFGPGSSSMLDASCGGRTALTHAALVRDDSRENLSVHSFHTVGDLPLPSTHRMGGAGAPLSHGSRSHSTLDRLPFDLDFAADVQVLNDLVGGPRGGADTPSGMPPRHSNSSPSDMRWRRSRGAEAPAGYSTPAPAYTPAANGFGARRSEQLRSGLLSDPQTVTDIKEYIVSTLASPMQATSNDMLLNWLSNNPVLHSKGRSPNERAYRSCASLSSSPVTKRLLDSPHLSRPSSDYFDSSPCSHYQRSLPNLREASGPLRSSKRPCMEPQFSA